MSYKRVVKKKGKSYGPYIYESYRDVDGKVKKRYLGKLEDKKSPSLILVILASLIFLLAVGYSTDFFVNGGKLSSQVSSGVSGFVVGSFEKVTGFVVSENETETSISEEEVFVEESEVEEIVNQTEVEEEEIVVDVIESENETEIVELNESLESVNETSEENSTVIEINQTVNEGENVSEEIVSENKTEIEEVENESDVEEIVEVLVQQNRAVVGRPVRWVKTVKANSSNFSVEVPASAQNVSVYVGEEISEGSVEAVVTLDNLSKESDDSSGFLEDFALKLSSISGNVVFEAVELEDASEDSVVVDVGDYVESSDEDVSVVYYTEPPIANESLVSEGKRIVVSADDELNYTNVLSYTILDLPSMAKIPMNSSKLKLYWYATEEDAIAEGYIGGDLEAEIVELNESEEIVNQTEVEEEEIVVDVIESENETEIVELNESLESVNETSEENSTVIEINQTVNEGENVSEEIVSENKTEIEEVENESDVEEIVEDIISDGDSVSEEIIEENLGEDSESVSDISDSDDGDSSNTESESSGDSDSESSSSSDDSSSGDSSSSSDSSSDDSSSESSESSSDSGITANVISAASGLHYISDFFFWFGRSGISGLVVGDLESSGSDEVSVLLDSEQIPDLTEKELIRIEVDYVPYDLDGDGYIDYVEWDVPHLSAQSYELIYVSNAVHLDGDLNFVEDVSDSVETLDGIYVEIPEGDFLEVTFEKNLTSGNDISVHAYGDDSDIEIFDSNFENVATIESVGEDGLYKVYLSELSGFEDNFYLKSVGGSVSYDWVIDPDGPALVIDSPEDGASYSSQTTLIDVTADSTNNFTIFDNRGLVTWWRMDDFDGSNLADYFGVYNGTVSGTVLGETGRMGNAATFDAASYVQTTEPFFVGDSVMSVAFWAKPNLDLLSAGEGIISNYYGSNSWEIWRHSDERFYFKLYNDSVVSGTYATSVYQDTEWHYYVVVFNGTRGIWWVDGVEDTAYASGNFVGTVRSSATTFRIGTSGESGTNYWNGSIDELMMWNRTLSEAEILALYANHTTHNYVESYTADVGENQITFYAMDELANVSSQTIDFSVDGFEPLIDFDPTTTAAGSSTDDYIYVNLTSSDDSDHYSFVDFDNDLKLWMRMDDVNQTGTGALVYDNSSYTNNGTASGDAVQTDAGYYGKGYSFDGTDWINLGNPASLQITNSISVAAWVKKTDSNHGFVVSKIDGTNSAYRLSFIENIYFSIVDGGAFKSISTAGTYNDGLWHHVVGTYDGAALRIYVDGQLETSPSAYVGDIDNDPSNVYIGARSDGALGFNGSIDEVMIWDEALTPRQVASLHNSSAYNYYNNYTGLSGGDHTFTAYAIDRSGLMNSTERTVTIESGAGSLSVCRDLDVENGVYTMTGNLTTTGDCLNVLANNITLDGMGYWIIGNNIQDSKGIYVSGYSNITLRNVSLKNFGATESGGSPSIHTVHFADSIGNVVENVSVLNDAQEYCDAFYFSNVNDTIVNDSVADSALNGFEFVSANNVSVNLTNATNMVSYGVSFTNSNLNFVEDGNLSANSGGGVFISGGGNNTLDSLNISNVGYGVFFLNTEYNYFNWSQVSTFSPSAILVLANDSGTSRNNAFENLVLQDGTLAVNVSADDSSSNYDNSFSNITITGADSYSFENSAVSDYSLSGDSFDFSDGGSTVAFTNDSIVASGSNLSAVVEAGSNYVFVNSTLDAGFNTTANITFTGVSYSDPKPIVDLNGDGSFVDCESPTCEEISYAGGVFTFNVSHFTNYSVGENNTAPGLNVSVPQNLTYWNSTSVYINISTDEVVEWCGVSIDGAANVSMLGSDMSWNYTATSLSEGSHYYSVYCNDSLGLVGSAESYTFYVDVETPFVAFTDNTTANAFTQSSDWVYVGLNTSDTNDYYSFVDFNDSIEGYWRGEDGARDESDEFLSLDGVDSYVDCGNDESLNLTADITLSLWIKNNPGKGGYALAKRSSTNGYNVFLGADGITLYYVDGAGSIRNLGETINLEEWTHVVYVVNSTGTGVTAYVDGVAGSTVAVSEVPGNSVPLTIGTKTSPAAAHYVNGSIDGVMVFNRSLTPLEISDIYVRGREDKAYNDSGLVSAWYFDGDSNDTVGSNDGSLQGGATYAGLVDGTYTGSEFTMTGRYGTAFNFTGSEQVGANGSLVNLADNFTVSVWAKRDVNDTSQRYILSKGAYYAASTRNIAISHETNGTWLRVYVGQKGKVSGATEMLPYGEWTHIALTFAEGDVMKVYINGTQWGTDVSLSGVTTTDGSDNFAIGGYYSGTASRRFVGGIDEVLVINRVLSPSEISQLYNSTSQVILNNFSGLPGGNYNFRGFAVDRVGHMNESESRTVAVVVPSGNKFVVQDSSGNNVASVDDQGNFFLKDAVFESQSSLSPSTNSFVIQNSSGSVVAYVNETGSLFLQGSVEQYSNLSGSSTRMEFQDSSGNVVAFVDSLGNLKLGRRLAENYLNP